MFMYSVLSYRFLFAILFSLFCNLRMESHVWALFGSLFQDFFYITKYNTISSIFYVFIGIINYKKKILLYFIQFYTGCSSRRVVRMISALGVIRNKKQKRLLFNMLVAPSRTRIKHFY